MKKTWLLSSGIIHPAEKTESTNKYTQCDKCYNRGNTSRLLEHILRNKLLPEEI